jgi:Na+/phosphate symporter
MALGSAIAVIMGANIGTTVTAWIFALSFGGGSWSIASIAIPLMFVAFVCISIKKLSNLGEFLMGFGLLFLGLSTMKDTSTVLLDNEGIRTFLSTLSGHGVWSIGLFMLAGAIITLMLQRMNSMIDLVDAAYDAIEHNLATPLVELHTIENAEEAENAINVYRDQLRTEHLTNIENSSYPYETGSFYMDLINCLEKMGDFIINISQSVLEAKTV